jgi:hypothetical protein
MKGPNLMVNVVVVGIVTREPLQRVEREGVSAVVVDGLEGPNYEHECGLAGRHPSHPLRDHSTARINEETLDRVVVLCAVRIRYMHPVVPGMDLFEQERVRMHDAV